MSHLICPLCPVERTSQLNLNLRNFMKHIQLFHSHQPSFSITCGLGGCLRNFSNFQVFRNHVSTFHSGDSTLSNTTTSVPTITGSDDSCVADTDTDSMSLTDEVYSGGTCALGMNQDDLKKGSALFLLGLKEKHKLTQVSVEGVVTGVTSLLQSSLFELQSQISNHLLKCGVSSDVITSMSSLFTTNGSVTHPFMGLETSYLQTSFYRTHFALIEPVRVTLGERHVWKGSGAKRRYVSTTDEIMYVPLLDTLQSILKSEDRLSEVLRGHKHSSRLADFCDGEVYSKHPLFSIHSNALQIFFYYDDVEVCNPLGSKAKIHKLSFFYFTLGNIHPKKRSQLSSIYLVAIAKHKVLTYYGVDAVLRPFVEDLKKLEQGHAFTIDGHSKVMYGCLCLVSADNLGSQALGGFKESCSAMRFCRQCMATHDDARTKFNEAEFVLRDAVSHSAQCDEIKTNPNASKEYGINRDSILNTLTYFNVCGGSLVPDVMHDILEGALQYEVKLMLRSFIRSEYYFTLEAFNLRLVSFELGYMESKDRPTPISEATLSSTGHSLKQNAAQMWLLGRILTSLLGDMIPDDDAKWINYLRLMEIVDYLFSPTMSEDTCAYLAALINDHHQEFTVLYPTESVIPKIHFMIHMARLIVEFGPLVRHMTMRYEAKHAYFKSLAQTIGNFINIPYTLATRHQHLRCYLDMTSQDSEVVAGPGVVVDTGVINDCDFSCDSVFRAKWVKVNGIEYKEGAGVVRSANEDDLLEIVKISFIYIADSNVVIFKGECFSTTYNPHFRAYLLHSLSRTEHVFCDKLICYTPLHIRASRAFPHDHVLLPYHIF